MCHLLGHWDVVAVTSALGLLWVASVAVSHPVLTHAVWIGLFVIAMVRFV